MARHHSARAVPPILVIVVLTALCSQGTGAQVTTDVDPPLQATDFLNFPYCRCMRSTSAYSLAPNVVDKGNGTFCFTLLVRNCNATCCKVDLKKIEIDVYPSCNVKSASVKTTLNGVPTTVGPNYYRADSGPPGSTVLRLTGLGLGLSSNGTEICLCLRAGNNDTGCDTLEELCVPPTANSPPGVCNIAMFNSNNSTGACCPQTTVGGNRPPPPRPPAPPPPPPPSPHPSPQQTPCTICLHFTIVPPLVDFPPYRFTNASCAVLQQLVVGNITATIEQLGLTSQMLQNFTVDPSGCFPTDIVLCGEFASTAVAAQLQAALQDVINAALDVLVGNVCPAVASTYSVRVFTEEGDCLNLQGGAACEPLPEPFPNCRCNKTQRITPIYVEPFLNVEPGRGNTTLYCFELSVVPPELRIQGNCLANNVSKLEIWADEGRRRNITGFRIHPNGGRTFYIAPTWGAKGDNTVRASPLNWNLTQSDGGEVCIELFNSVSLRDFCLGGGNGCVASLFNELKDCCPAYPSALRLEDLFQIPV